MIADLLQRAFSRNGRVIHAQAEGLTHEQSLIQSPYNVNCFNWIVGHIVDGRSQLLVRLGYDGAMPDAVGARYRGESDPITEDGPGVVAFGDLMTLLDRSQTLLDGMLLEATDEWLFEETAVAEDRMASRLRQIHFTYFHDTYHAGQTELLRQMSGFSDKII